MHRHETESSGNFCWIFKVCFDNHKSIHDVMAQQSVQISFERLLTLLCSLEKTIQVFPPDSTYKML